MNGYARGAKSHKRRLQVFAAQLAVLEQEYARSPPLLKMLGREFGFGAAGKLERARFKVSYKREQLAEFESQHLDGRPER
jgi:50S ribosomal subunit-associated GTPase HflX